MRAYQLSKGGAGIEGLAPVERPDPKPLSLLVGAQGLEPWTR
jgi:hypothetical protein